MTAAEQVLEMIRAQNPLGQRSVHQLRQDFERFCLQFSGPLRPEVTPDAPEGLSGCWIAAPGADQGRTLLFFHGGGFTIGSSLDHQDLCARLSAAAGARVYSLEYRLAPEHPFPAAPQDALAAYRWLLDQGLPPERIMVTGISAGGALMLTTLCQARDLGLPLPAGGLGLSPATDLHRPGLAPDAAPVHDWLTIPGLDASRLAYLAGHDPDDPLASPVMADLAGLPPLLLQAGGWELLRDRIQVFTQKAQRAGVAVTLEVWPEMIHCWQMFASMIPEGQQALDSLGRFVRQLIPAA